MATLSILAELLQRCFLKIETRVSNQCVMWSVYHGDTNGISPFPIVLIGIQVLTVLLTEGESPGCKIYLSCIKTLLAVIYLFLHSCKNVVVWSCQTILPVLMQKVSCRYCWSHSENFFVSSYTGEQVILQVWMYSISCYSAIVVFGFCRVVEHELPRDLPFLMKGWLSLFPIFRHR